MNNKINSNDQKLICAHQLCKTSDKLAVADPNCGTQRRAIAIYDAVHCQLLKTTSSINCLLEEYKDLRPTTNLVQHCIILNYLFWGYSYDIIEDVDAFRACYEKLPKPKYNISTVAAPNFEGNKAVFFVKQGIKKPVKVTVSYETVQPDGSDRYEAVRAVCYADLPLLENEKRQTDQLALATQLHPLSKINSVAKATSVVHDGLNTTGEKPNCEQSCD